MQQNSLLTKISEKKHIEKNSLKISSISFQNKVQKRKSETRHLGQVTETWPDQILAIDHGLWQRTERLRQGIS